jgi:uncharacterized membrane protein
VYAIKYIRQALTSPSLPAPDKAKAGEDYDALHALYESHQEDGPNGAQKAWKSIKKFAPHLDQKPRLYNANDLVNLVIPKYALPTGYAIYEFGFNILIGKRGAGKSFIALDIAARIAENNPDRTVIYTAGEGLPSYSPRWEAWKKHHQLHLKNLLFWDGAVQLLDAESYTQFAKEVRDLKPIFIIVDTVARAMTGFSENDNTVMGQFVQAVDEMMRELEVGVLLVHHEGRNGEMRGASSLDGAADSVLVLKRDDRQIVLYNDFAFGGKNKHQEEAPTLYFDFVPVDVMIQGGLISAAVVVLSEKADEDAAADDSPLKGNDAKIFEIIDANDGISADALAETAQIHRATVYRITDRLAKRGKIHQDKTKKWRTGQAEI